MNFILHFPSFLTVEERNIIISKVTSATLIKRENYIDTVDVYCLYESDALRIYSKFLDFGHIV